MHPTLLAPKGELRQNIGYQHFPKAALQGDVENGLVVAGQIVGMVRDLPGVGELMERIVADAANALGEKSGLAAPTGAS